ncbi:MAG: hypothetical protein ACHQUC_07315 [Chlamydiales bacterium]
MKYRETKKWIVAITLVAALFGLVRLYYYLTDDFRLSNITYSNIPYQSAWKNPPPSSGERAQINRILDQKFYYIDKGAQSYAFGSEDQQYVLKFFKFKHLKPHWLIELLPSISPLNHLKEQNRMRKQRKLSGVFEGYEIAYHYNKEGSQLIYLHLTPTDYLKLHTTVFDKMGRAHEIDLDQTVFLLQKKGEPLRERLKRLLDQGQIDQVKSELSLIFEMYLKEYQLGLYDRDHGVLQNTGFIDMQPFHMDVGKMSKDERMKNVEEYKKDLELVFWKVDFWIKTYYPQYHGTFKDYITEEYQRLTGSPLNIDRMTPEDAKARRRQYKLSEYFPQKA